jgi:hypothetical protein
MHNPMFVSHVAQSAWHAWMLCRLLMADLRARRTLHASEPPALKPASGDAVAMADEPLEATERRERCR